MSIDGIGKGRGVPAPSVDSSGSAPEGVGSKPSSEFKVSKSSAASSVEPLERLRAGEISVPEYLDMKVSEATGHLEGRLDSEQLSFVRTNLRDQLSTDPVLVDLVKSATGSVPPPHEE